MKKPANGLIIVSLALLMCGVGLAVAFFMFLNMDHNIPWKHFTLPSPPEEIVAISHIEFHSYLDDPTGDTIYITTKDGAVYSNTLFEKNWLSVKSSPAVEEDQTSDCAPTWAGAESDAQISDAPPTGNDVRDSAGVRFEHALATDVRCYVLSNDGDLEVWARGYDAVTAGIVTFIHYSPAFGCVGSIIGVIIGVLVVRFRNKGSIRAK